MKNEPGDLPRRSEKFKSVLAEKINGKNSFLFVSRFQSWAQNSYKI